MRVKKYLILLMIIFPILTLGNENACPTDTLVQLKKKIHQLSPEPLQKSKLDDKAYVKKRVNILSQIEVMFRDNQYARCITPEYIAMAENQNKIAVNELKQILEKYIWITIPEFGFKTSEDAWIIVQHAVHDPAFQHQVLFLMEYCLSRKEVDPLHYANLYDRTTFHYRKFEMKQRYGTQSTYDEKNKEFELLPYDGNFEDLKKRRCEIGLSVN